MASDTHRHHQSTPSRLGLRHTGGGEIVEVQGGHIVRSIGRKDRHSKVCTAKGPRDRRVRLSAHTAIQFYDVQDRLGFDRPSKAVDWLIKKAKPAIDELAELPAWNPSLDAVAATTSSSRRGPTNTLVGTERSDVHPNQQQQQQQQQQEEVRILLSSENNNNNNNNNSSSFLPASLDSDAIADTIKSFFPMGASAEANSSPIQQQQFHNFPPPDLLSRTSSQSQDLRLSLHSFQDPILLQLHHQQQQQQNQSNEQGLFSGTGYDSPSAGWSEHQNSEINRFQRMVAWNATGTGGGGGGFVFNSPPTPQFFGQNQFVSQRGPLQSSNTPSVRAWIDPISATDHHHHQHQNQIHQTSFPGIGFASVDGFSEFRIPARIQGEQEEHDGISDKPSSASSDSRH